MQTLGERIAYYRKKNGMTQEQLAEKCSVTPQAVSKWENDLTAPDISLLPRLAELFSVSTDELLGVRKKEVVAVDPALVDLSGMMFKVRVLSKDGDKVNVNLPLSVAEAVLASGILGAAGGEEGKLDFLKNIDLKQVISLVRLGAMGKLVEVESAEGDSVEVWVE